MYCIYILLLLLCPLLVYVASSSLRVQPVNPVEVCDNNDVQNEARLCQRCSARSAGVFIWQTRCPPCLGEIESNLPPVLDWTLTASGLSVQPISEVHLSPQIPACQSRNISGPRYRARKREWM